MSTLHSPYQNIPQVQIFQSILFHYIVARSSSGQKGPMKKKKKKETHEGGLLQMLCCLGQWTLVEGPLRVISVFECQNCVLPMLIPRISRHHPSYQMSTFLTNGRVYTKNTFTQERQLVILLMRSKYKLIGAA